jgi:uncharacterized protein (DUF433 family)
MVSGSRTLRQPASRRPVSVILDRLVAGMTADGIATEYPSATTAEVRAAAAYGAAPTKS